MAIPAAQPLRPAAAAWVFHKRVKAPQSAEPPSVLKKTTLMRLNVSKCQAITSLAEWLEVPSKVVPWFVPNAISRYGHLFPCLLIPLKLGKL